MTNYPGYFVIAGPNGAGKSLNGDKLVPSGVQIFNDDLELARLQQKYPALETIRLQGGVASLLENAKLDALNQRKHFAFETNYATDMASEMASMFKNAGYHTTLIYFGLDNLEDSLARVKQRIKDGRHDVPDDVMKYNFEESTKRIIKDLPMLDVVLFEDVRQQQVNIVSVADYQRQLLYSAKQNVQWYERHFKSNVERPQLKSG